MNLYNDIDSKPCAWTEELIRAGLVPPGDVVCKSITDITPHDLQGYTHAHFFNGISGWAYALELAGWPATRPVWCASLPCQPFSAAGKQLGEADERHLWPVFRALVEACKPPIIFGEQVASALGRDWFSGVRTDLEALGYEVGASDLCAAGTGAPHIRQRLFWAAYSKHAKRGAEHQEHGEAYGRDRPEWGGTIGGLEFTAGERRGGARIPDGRQSQASGTSETRRLEHSESDGRQQRGTEPERGSVTSGRGTSGVAYSDEPSPGEEREQRSGELCGARGDQGTGWLDNPGRSRGQAWIPAQARGSEGDTEIPYHRSSGRPWAWGECDILSCADGKARRIKSGTTPLVAGLPRGVVPSGDPSTTEAEASAEERIARLRGYGNSIVPQLAAEFILASIEAINDLHTL